MPFLIRNPFKTKIKLNFDLIKTFFERIKWRKYSCKIMVENKKGHKAKSSNKKGIDFYRQLVAELKDNGIEPLITIYHFDLPLCLQKEYGGWLSRKVIEDFSYYCKVLFKNFGNDVKYWFTINEQSNMFLLPHLMVFNDKIPIEKQKYSMNHIMTLAHARAIEIFREMVPNGKIGPALGISPNYPASCKPEDVEAAKIADDFNTYLFTDLYFRGCYRENVLKYMEENDIVPMIEKGDMELIGSAKPDFLGVNYYQSKAVRYARENIQNPTSSEIIPGLYKVVDNPYLDKTKWGWEIDPIGLRILLNNLNDRYHLPIIITENGIGDIETLTIDERVHDEYRINFLKKHLEQCNLAVNDGVNLFGYCIWSFMDLLSTSSGFNKRYGLVYVNRNDRDLKDLKRIKKDSFYWYKEIIDSNGKSLENLLK